MSRVLLNLTQLKVSYWTARLATLGGACDLIQVEERVGGRRLGRCNAGTDRYRAVHATRAVGLEALYQLSVLVAVQRPRCVCVL